MVVDTRGSLLCDAGGRPLPKEPDGAIRIEGSSFLLVPCKVVHVLKGSLPSRIEVLVLKPQPQAYWAEFPSQLHSPQAVLAFLKSRDDRGYLLMDSLPPHTYYFEVRSPSGLLPTYGPLDVNVPECLIPIECPTRFVHHSHPFRSLVTMFVGMLSSQDPSTRCKVLHLLTRCTPAALRFN